MYIKNKTPDYIIDTPVAVRISSVKRCAPHYHADALEFVYCLSGSADFTISHEHMQLHKGEIVLIEHENFHSISSSDGALLLQIHIDINRCGHDPESVRYMYFSCASELCKPHQADQFQNIRETLLTIACLYTQTQEQDIRIYEKIACRLVDVLIKHFTWFTIEGFTPEENETFRERLARILTYIQKHFRDRITLSMIAHNEYINENYFSQFIKRTSFHSFTQMVNYIRCFEAENLLLTTDMSVQDISDACGFSSKKYFHKYFKFFWETTPLQHRIAIMKKAELPDETYILSPSEALPLIEHEICENLIWKLS